MTSQSTELVNSTVAEWVGETCLEITVGMRALSELDHASGMCLDMVGAAEHSHWANVMAGRFLPPTSATVELTNSVDCEVITDCSHVPSPQKNMSAFPTKHQQPV
jgi:hypothetical protein